LGHGQRNKRLDFGGGSDYDPDPRIFLKDSLFIILLQFIADSQEYSMTVLSRGLNSLECFVVLATFGGFML